MIAFVSLTSDLKRRRNKKPKIDRKAFIYHHERIREKNLFPSGSDAIYASATRGRLVPSGRIIRHPFPIGSSQRISGQRPLYFVKIVSDNVGRGRRIGHFIGKKLQIKGIKMIHEFFVGEHVFRVRAHGHFRMPVLFQNEFVHHEIDHSRRFSRIFHGFD